MPEITIPNQWTPMAHQMPVWEAMQGGTKRAALSWHRRAGKDSFAINYLATAAMQKPGVYWHMLPSALQGRKVIWNGIDRHGRKVIDQAIPKEIRKKSLDQEMFIELVNGSVIQIVGSDNFDSLVGANPIGVVFSEYAIANPLAWAYIRPMLAENNGWAIFISTPRGHNHFHRMFKNNETSPNWFCEMRDITQTFREDGTPIISPEVLDEERREGMDESLLQQEYFVSWEGGLQGAYFTDEVNNIRTNRLGHYPITDGMAMTAWDIGVADKTAIGVFMAHPETGHPILMDAYEDRNKGLPYYLKQIRRWQEDYLFQWHFGPHDLHKTDWASDNLRMVDRAQDMGLNFEVLPRGDLADGIDNLRSFLRILHVNETPGTLHVLDMLQSYRRQFDDKNNVFKEKPLHDYASDSTDMMRYAAQAYDPANLKPDYARRKFTAKRAIG
jgi:hypothetical protein